MTRPIAERDDAHAGGAKVDRGLGSALLLLAGLALCVLAYLPGLDGGFLLDDWLHLPSLGAYGGVVDAPRLALYLTANGGDTLGRPLTLLSFLLDDNGWPSDAFAFKRTSLLLHLINGLLLTLLLLRLGARVGLDATLARRAAVLGALLWLLHPLFVSTTLYVIQRATILATAFLLLSMLAWDACWQAQVDGKLRRAGLLACGVLLAALAGALCKANGILTPVLLACTACLVYRPLQASLPVGSEAFAARIRRWTIELPAAASLAAVLLYSAWSVWLRTDANGWSWSGRVLSQPRALIEYLGLLLLPREASRGVFTDSFPLSSGLWHPPSTLGAMLLLAALGFAAWHWRRRPIVSLPIATFLAGHLLESGVINLEPYFEHRNYLPSVLLPWPLAIALLQPQGRLRAVRRSVAALLPLLLAGITFQRASTWSDERVMAALAGARFPTSQRVQLFLSSAEIAAGRSEDAIARLETALDAMPDKPLLAFNLIHASCVAGRSPEAGLARARHALRRAAGWGDRSIYAWLSQRIEPPALASCQGLQREQLVELLAAAADNPNLSHDRSAQQDLVALSAELALAAGQRPAGQALLERALALDPSPESCAWLAGRLARLADAAAGAEFVQRHDACDLGRRARGHGLGLLHTRILERHPEHDVLRQLLQPAPIAERAPARMPEVIKPQPASER
jgi:protein O-mannosyl-transferase